MANRIGIRGRNIKLYARFLDAAGNPVNADEIPQVEISDSAGTVVQGLTDIGTSLDDDPGLYVFSYDIPLTVSVDGYFTDRWVADVGDEQIESTFTFLVLTAGTIEEATAPDHQPGDSVPFNFTQEEIGGINILLSILKKRLKNDGVRKVPDGQGGFIEEPCFVFNDTELICFLVNSLSEFNQYPHFTAFTFADDLIQTRFVDIITQGAVLVALAAQALIEKGREFSITDSGVTYQPPQVADMLNTQYSAQLQDYKEKLKHIKTSLKPGPVGLGTFRVTSVNPNFLRLRHLRQRQIL